MNKQLTNQWIEQQAKQLGLKVCYTQIEGGDGSGGRHETVGVYKDTRTPRKPVEARPRDKTLGEEAHEEHMERRTNPFPETNTERGLEQEREDRSGL